VKEEAWINSGFVRYYIDYMGIMGFNYRPLRFMEDVLPDAIPDPVILKDKNKIQELADMQLLKPFKMTGKEQRFETGLIVS